MINLKKDISYNFTNSEGRIMDYMDKVNNAIDFIEANITDDIDLNLAARKACCSEYHFLRTFSFLAGIPLSEYIRRRKLTLAAFDLFDGVKVVDVASKYGYSSPEAFARAFKGLHGITPIAARNTDAPLKAYPKITFHLSLSGDGEIDYRIAQKNSYEVCGITIDVPILNEKTNTVITQFWEENIGNGVIGQFHRDIGLEYNICLNAALFNYNKNTFSYMICYEMPSSRVHGEYSVLSVPSFTWAVFSTPEHTSKETTDIIRNMRKRIFMEWFPTSVYKHAGGPEFEIFHNKNDKFVVEIWVPIIKKPMYDLNL
ncbi:AraC family transcriptional regulator [Lachnoclostridium phytofermentans]|uniref:Transcriptional regulator, AraC family n=1 Tax=Lachnoclostridium phytofermentans (strain ATCC 700394 / DSM 18823 / ISDg) TaxID=357809 RepID=A9KJ61_LACP7|nr:AraC family transcriptional regulator [Lachnoclostridium phytofermentans]ABX42473.1 transcriptional regulator, AraC family [Lachnoclostridium phytofermentans ISDg]